MISIELINQVKNLYESENLSIPKISKKLGFSSSKIQRCLIRGNVSRRPFGFTEDLRKYSVNEDYFRHIDSSDKAYFLGLLFADGTMDDRNSNISIGLKEEDGYILERFIKYSEFTGKTFTYLSNNKNHSNRTVLNIYNKNFYLNAFVHGLVPRKSLILRFPQHFSFEYYSHFIRGYFDGDGCIHQNRAGKLRLSFIGTYEFLSVLLDVFMNSLNVGFVKVGKKSKTDSNNYVIQFAVQSDIESIFDFMYQDKTDLFLKRKFNKFNQ